MGSFMKASSVRWPTLHGGLVRWCLAHRGMRLRLSPANSDSNAAVVTPQATPTPAATAMESGGHAGANSDGARDDISAPTAPG